MLPFHGQNGDSHQNVSKTDFRKIDNKIEQFEFFVNGYEWSSTGNRGLYRKIATLR
jgi:hypothetical protein